jgi:SAM-dependent methyltransferase
VANIHDVVIDCAHPASLARFWAAVLDDYEVAPYDEAELARLRSTGVDDPEDDPTVLVESLPGVRPRLFFQRVPETKVAKNRVHLDLTCADLDMEVDRLVALGAGVVARYDGWVTLTDPAGNEFCVQLAKPGSHAGIGDALGAILRRYHESGTAYEIVERADGRITAHDAGKYFVGPDEWSPVDRWACEQAAGRVLDVGCGAGRHAVPLAARGLDVVGLDVSPGAVEVTTRRGANAVLGTVERLPPHIGTFDTLLLLGAGFGLLGNPGRAAAVLANLAAVTRQGGQLIGTGHDPHHDDANRDYHEWNRQRGRLAGQRRIRIRDGHMMTGWFDYLFASVDEVRQLFAGTPWQVSEVYEDGLNYAIRLSL